MICVTIHYNDFTDCEPFSVEAKCIETAIGKLIADEPQCGEPQNWRLVALLETMKEAVEAFDDSGDRYGSARSFEMDSPEESFRISIEALPDKPCKACNAFRAFQDTRRRQGKEWIYGTDREGHYTVQDRGEARSLRYYSELRFADGREPVEIESDSLDVIERQLFDHHQIVGFEK